ncbi:MAG: hypothetical protein B7Z75_13245 [Acidocella sp. 20-57-95]|nr:MAG: hypothetical protein B7Z75_13245 [Acidocella sp. 20-57-95]
MIVPINTRDAIMSDQSSHRHLSRPGEAKMKWFLDRAAFLFAIVTLSGLIAGWFLPTDQQLVTSCALGQVCMAIIVGIHESWKLYLRKVSGIPH